MEEKTSKPDQISTEASKEFLKGRKDRLYLGLTTFNTLTLGAFATWQLTQGNIIPGILAGFAAAGFAFATVTKGLDIIIKSRRK